MLSEGAHADSVPNLDIEENDVRCSHASTVGPIDEDQRYYLESRGINPAVAERLIVLGFFSDLAARAPLPGAGSTGPSDGSRETARRSARRRTMADREDGRGHRELVRLCGRQEIDRGRPGASTWDACPVALVRIEDDFYALCDTCSHEDYSLSEGEVLTEECEIECWKHGSTFDLRTGEPRPCRPPRPVPVYPVHLEGDDVMVELP